MALNKLPDELVLRVVYQLESPKDLSNLALCSHHLHAIAIPILYSSFAENEKQFTWVFLCTLWKRPDLARFVKSFTRTSWSVYWSPPDWLDSHRDDVKDILEMVFATSEDKSEKNLWLWDFYSGENWDAVTAFVLLLLPNITTLKLPESPRPSTWVTKALHRACKFQDSNTSSPYSLSHLRDVELAADYWARGDVFADIVVPFLRLQSLRRFTCAGLWLRQRNIESLRGSTSNVTHFSLPCSDINSLVLAELLKCLPRLVHLTYCHNSMDTEEEGAARPFIPRAVRDGLMPSRFFLEELVLVNHEEEWEDFAFEVVPLPLGSLAEFEKLRKIDATVYTLVGRENSHQYCNVQFVESLPQSLEILVLRNCEPDIWSLLHVLLDKRRKGSLGKLRIVNLVSRTKAFMDLFASREAAKKYGDEAENLGIMLNIVVGLPVGEVALIGGFRPVTSQ
jgi:hypothetical protein